MDECLAEAKHRPIVFEGQENNPRYYHCNLKKGHDGEHKAFANGKLIEKWENTTK